MEETWRWFGPEDTISLEQIRQAGATGVVTALDPVPTGAVWPAADIDERKRLIAAAPGIKGRAKTLLEFEEIARFALASRPIPFEEKAAAALS